MSIDISAPTRQLELIIADAAYEAIIKQIRLKLSNIQSKIALEIRRAINASPAVTSMLGGQLQTEFGFIEPTTIVRKLLDAIEQSIEIQVGGKEPILLEIILDKDKLIGSGVGEFRTKNGEVPWLDWLLSSGGKVVIVGWHIEYGVFPRKVGFVGRAGGSRSGHAKMVQGGTYAVQKFAGTQEKNFITDAIDDRSIKEITEAIRSVLI